MLAILGDKVAPSFADWYLAKTGFKGQQIADMPVAPGRPDNLYEPVQAMAATHGVCDAQAKTRSPQLSVATHRPALAGALAGIAAAAAVGAARLARLPRRRPKPP